MSRVVLHTVHRWLRKYMRLSTFRPRLASLVVRDSLIRRFLLCSYQATKKCDRFHTFLQLFARRLVGVGPGRRGVCGHGGMLVLRILLVRCAGRASRSLRIRQLLGTRGALEDLLWSRPSVSVMCLCEYQAARGSTGTYLRQRVDRCTEVLSERGMPAWAWASTGGGT